jgi:transcription initiation factor IIF auxiliary subunit
MSLKIAQDSQYQGNNWWKWSIWIEGPAEELNHIKSVTYVLHPTFANPVRTVADRASNFKLKAHGWGIFPIRINVLKENGKTVTLEHELELSRPDTMLGKMFPSEGMSSEAVERSGERTADKVASEEVQTEMGILAKEYEDIRRSMPAGDPRTRKMETIASKMRSLAHPDCPLLKSFVESSSAGERLAAVSILEAIPNQNYLTWLADRIATEKPFIGYHAAVALLNAVRSLRSSHRGKVEKAIMRAQAHLNKRDWKDPNQVTVLRRAQQELKKE